MLVVAAVIAAVVIAVLVAVVATGTGNSDSRKMNHGLALGIISYAQCRNMAQCWACAT